MVAKEDEAGWSFGDDRKGYMLPIPLSAKAKEALKELAKSLVYDSSLRGFKQKIYIVYNYFISIYHKIYV